MYMPPSNNNQSMSDLLKTASPAGAEDPFADVKAEMADRFALLPEELQKVIMGSDYQQKLFDIAKTHKMTFEELGTLELETTMVLLGMTRPEEYRDEMQVELKKNDIEIDALVKDVNEKVLAPVRGALERVYAAKKDPADYLTKEPSVSDAPAMRMTPPVSTPAPVAPTPTMSVPTPSAPAPMFTPAPAPVVTPTPAPVIPQPSINTLSDILSPAEKSVLEKTGVILNDSPAIPESQAQSSSPIIAPATISPERNEMLHDIEFPPKSSPSLMPQMPAKSAASAPAYTPTPIFMTPPVSTPAPVMQAPSQPSVSPTPMMGIPPATTSYAIPKAIDTIVPPSGPVTPKPSTDPYREPIS